MLVWSGILRKRPWKSHRLRRVIVSMKLKNDWQDGFDEPRPYTFERATTDPRVSLTDARDSTIQRIRGRCNFAGGWLDSLHARARLDSQSSRVGECQLRVLQGDPTTARTVGKGIAIRSTLTGLRYVFPGQYMSMRKELSPKKMLAVRCPTCGAAPGEKCELNTGQPRTGPHRERRLIAKEQS